MLISLEKIPLDLCEYRSIYLSNIQSSNQSIERESERKFFFWIERNFTKTHCTQQSIGSDRIDCVSYKDKIYVYSVCWLFIVDLLLVVVLSL